MWKFWGIRACLGLSCWVGMASLLSAADPPTANSPTAPPNPPAKKRDMSKAESLTVTAKDTLPIHMIYWGSELGRESPVVIHLHGKGGTFRDYPPPFIEQLHKAGYAQILVELRGHGGSKGAGLSAEERKDPTIQRLESGKLRASDYDDMALLDMEAVKQFIYEEHQAQYLNMNRTAVIAMDMSTPVAAAFALVDWEKEPFEDAPTFEARTPRGQDVRGLVLISPVSKVGNITMSQPLDVLGRPEVSMSFLLIYGSDDRLDKGATERFFKSLNPADKNKSRVELLKVDQALRGSELLSKNLGVEGRIQAFLDKHVKGMGSEWRDRQTRLDKKRAK